MVTEIHPGTRTGHVNIPASKSQVHRLLICAALSSGPTEISLDGFSKDILATAACLKALGTEISIEEDKLTVDPAHSVSDVCVLKCGESGSTLRFLMPVVGALGATAVFDMEGRLPQRPLEPYDDELRHHGMEIIKKENRLYCSGTLQPGKYSLPGNVSSQYISGLLMALPHLPGDSTLQITGNLESAAYITMTEEALRLAGIRFQKENNNYFIPGNQTGRLPRQLRAEGDWSNAAFFFCMGAFSDCGISVSGLRQDSRQGDRRILEVLRAFGAGVTETPEHITVQKNELHGTVIDASPIPDLIPTLSVVAAMAEGETRIINAGRLRLKESDRLKTTADLLARLGADVSELPDGLVIHGKNQLTGASVCAFGDHRIAMSAAVAASVCNSSVFVDGSESTAKSYPRFWEDLDSLTIETT